MLKFDWNSRKLKIKTNFITPSQHPKTTPMTRLNLILITFIFSLLSCHGDVREFENNIPFTPEKRLLADHIISVFENGTPVLQYGYAEDLNDGRGITAGRAGFTTANGDLLQVVQNYTDLVPNNVLAIYLPLLETLAANEDGSTTGLNNFVSDWALAAQDPAFRSIQDAVVDELYYLPALQYCIDMEVKTPLSLLCVYDAIIQHGDGDDEDGLSALLDRAGKSPADGRSEERWLKRFNEARRDDLLDPFDEDSQEEWSESVGRVDALLKLLEEENFELTTPLVLNPFGDEFVLYQ